MPRKFIRRPRRKIIRRRRVFRKKPSKSLKKLVQKIISKNVEDKQAFHESGDSLVYFNSYINSSGDMQQVLPNISVGAAENERIGAKIRAKNLVIKGYLQLEPDTTQNNADNKRVAVRLMVVSSKKSKALPDVQALAGAQLLEKGGTTTNFSGYISHLYAPINTEQWTKHFDKIFYLSQDYIVYQAGSSVSMLTNSNMSKGIRFFTIRIPLRGKHLIYAQDVASGVQPVNFAPVLCAGYAHLNGSSPDAVNTKVGICYDVTFHYEDA